MKLSLPHAYAPRRGSLSSNNRSDFHSGRHLISCNVTKAILLPSYPICEVNFIYSLRSCRSRQVRSITSLPSATSFTERHWENSCVQISFLHDCEADGCQSREQTVGLFSDALSFKLRPSKRFITEWDLNLEALTSFSRAIGTFGFTGKNSDSIFCSARRLPFLLFTHKLSISRLARERELEKGLSLVQVASNELPSKAASFSSASR